MGLMKNMGDYSGLLKGLGISIFTVFVVVSVFSPKETQRSPGSECTHGVTYHMGGAYSCNSPRY
jgi:hypothetical protein